MAYDEMELDLLGDRRTALFVIISDTDDTFNFVVSIMYTQLFNLLCDRADDQCGGQLKYHVRLLLDEFANIGLIPKFDKLIATIRSREISAWIEDFKSYQNLTSLNRRVLVALVERITVYDKEHIHIQYRFDQEIRNVLEYCSSVPAAETEESAV